MVTRVRPTISSSAQSFTTRTPRHDLRLTQNNMNDSPKKTRNSPQAAGQKRFVRGEGISVWRQISEDIANKINSGIWEEGQRLPTEAELSESYGVNRHTLRRALLDLSRRGLVEAAPRRGTFVSNARIEYPIRAQTRFSEIIRGAGREPGGKLLSCRLTNAPPEMAQRLGIAEKARVVEAEFLRFANQVPVCWSFSWFPADRFARLPQYLERGLTVSDALSHVGLKSYFRRETLVSARAANVKERSMLQLDRGGAVLVTESVNVDGNEEPTQAARSIFSANLMQLVIKT